MNADKVVSELTQNNGNGTIKSSELEAKLKEVYGDKKELIDEILKNLKDNNFEFRKE
jgi:hypothetical protein